MGYQVKVGSFKVDVFFIIAIAVCVVLYFIFDDKRYDIMATSVMIAGFGVIDTFINYHEDNEDGDKE